MKAVLLGPQGLTIDEAPAPTPGPDEVLVRVRAVALNHADLAVLAGQQHGSVGGVGTVLGMEWAGEVLACGPRVQAHRPGDRVMGSGRGALAELAVSDQGRVLPLPRPDMAFSEAAMLPVALQTMHDALVTHGRLQRGQTVLIHGASSGVGLMGLRIARHLGAAKVFGSSRQAERRAELPAYGAHATVDIGAADWAEQLRHATGGRGVDVVVDMLSGPQANATLAATAIGGRIVNVGRLAGQRAEFDFDLHALRRISYIGVTFRTRSVQEVRELVQRMRDDLWPALAAGELALPQAASFPLERVAEAFALLKAKTHFGKIVVTLP